MNNRKIPGHDWLIGALLGVGVTSLCLPLAAATGNGVLDDAATVTVTEEAQLATKLAMERPIEAVDSYWLEDLTWLEIRDLLAAGTTTVIIPTGGIEENGPFLATGKHNLILEATCPSIAKKLGNALCAPIVKFVPEGNIDPPDGAMRFSGSISLSHTTYKALLEDIASSLKQHGFRDIVMIGDSGGNQRGMDEIAKTLNERWRDTATRAHFMREFYDPGWDATENYTRNVLGVHETRNDGHHDDIWVTAMMMVSDPEQVRYEQRVAAGLASINGVSIADRDASIELGRRMIEFRAALTADAIRAGVAARRVD